MHLFATLVGCLLALAASMFLIAGVVALRMRARRSRLVSAAADLAMIIEASVWHAEHELRPDGKLSEVAGAALKAEVVALVREMGAPQIRDLVEGLRIPAAMVEPLLSGMIEKAVVAEKAKPAAPASDPTSDQPSEQ